MSLPSENPSTIEARASESQSAADERAAHAAPLTRRRSRWPIVIGCAGLVLVGCFAIGVGGYFFARDWLQENFAGLLPGTQESTVAYILDTSPRMSDAAQGGTRLAVAQAILAEIVRPADPALISGLRVFGGGAQPQACQDTELVVSYAPANQAAIAEELLGLRVGGSTESALAQSMVAAIRDLQSVRGPHSIVVVTGGADSCSPQAGELLAREAEAAGIELHTYVVGFQVPPEEAVALKTMTESAPGGAYYDAPDAEALRSALGDIQRQIEQPAIISVLPSRATSAAEEQREEEREPAQPTDGYVSETACDHPYFPLRAGASWTYASSDGFDYSWTVSSVSGDLSSATAQVTMDFDGGSLAFEWTCDSQGVLFYQLGAVTADDLGAVASFEITSSSGAPLPSAEILESGASWNNNYTMSYEVGAAGFSTAFTSTVQESHSAGVPDTLSTALGEFEAIPVSGNATSTTSSDFGNFTVSWSNTCWYGYGVGLLRCESSGEGFSNTSELASYTVP